MLPICRELEPVNYIKYYDTFIHFLHCHPKCSIKIENHDFLLCLLHNLQSLNPCALLQTQWHPNSTQTGKTDDSIIKVIFMNIYS